VGDKAARTDDEKKTEERQKLRANEALPPAANPLGGSSMQEIG